MGNPSHLLTSSERDLMACLGDMLKTADAVNVSRRKVALIIDAAMFDRFNELVDVVTFDDREPYLTDSIKGDDREADADFEPDGCEAA